MEYASNAKGNTGVTLGAIGTGLGAVNALGGMGALAGLFGNGCINNNYVTKDNLEMAMKIAAKDSEIALLKSEQSMEVKVADVYERLASRINANKAEQDAINRDQAVYNGVNNATVSVLRSQVDQLMGLTALHIPSANVCPTPMPQFNSWTAPTT